MVNINKKQNSKLFLRLCYLLTLLCVPTCAFADGGGPLLLLISVFAFTIGQIWILSVETAYFKIAFKNISLSYSFGSVFFMNLASTIVGGILFPVLISVITLLFSFIFSWVPSVSGVIIALGTWVIGDNSPNPGLAIGMTVFWFICAYFLTVYVEYRVLCKRLEKIEFEIEKRKLKAHCFILNLASYAGLTVLFFMLK